MTEKTGYPAEMLDPELDLEADLGVDTVKQAELFTAVREEWGIPRDDNRKLRDYPTLAHVVRFVYDNRPDLVPGGASASAAAGSAPGPRQRHGSGSPSPPAVGSFAEAAKVPRRVAVPVLRPALPYCGRRASRSRAGRRVAVMFDRGGAAEALVERLRTRGVDVLTLENGASAESLAERLAEWTAGGPVHGLFWLPALDAEGDLRSMDLAAFREALRVRVKNLYSSARALYDALGAPGTFLVSRHPPRRPPRLRRRGRRRPARRRGHRLHQGVQAREARGDRQGGRLRPRRGAVRRRRPPHRGGASRPGLRRGRLRRTASAPRSGCASCRSRTGRPG